MLTEHVHFIMMNFMVEFEVNLSPKNYTGTSENISTNVIQFVSRCHLL